MKKLLNAFVKTILLFAAIHIIVLLAAFLKTGNLSVLNIARILEINRILPVDVAGSASDIISLLSVALVYGIAYLRFTK